MRLIDGLLDVSRVSRGRIELRRQVIPAADVIASAFEASRPLIESAGHAVSLELAPKPIWLDADPTRISQVVGNLLNNAAKYTLPGGRIAVSLRREGGEAVIAVAGTGVGIPWDRQSEVF